MRIKDKCTDFSGSAQQKKNEILRIVQLLIISKDETHNKKNYIETPGMFCLTNETHLILSHFSSLLFHFSFYRCLPLMPLHVH